MKKLNKLFLAAGSVAAVAAPVAAVVSCGTTKNAGTPEPSKTMLVTDGGSVDDKSFNEQAAQALNLIKGHAINAKLAPTDYLQPSAHDAGAILKAYQAAATKGATTILAPGFYHVDAINSFIQSHKNAVNFIVADGVVKADNVASVTFNTKQPAFLAGVLAAKKLNEVGGDADSTHKVGMWGGGNFAGVTDYMTGFIAGIKYFNETVAKGDATKQIHFAKLSNNQTDYVNSGFEAGRGKAQAEALVKDGADVILPVAGGQTVDAINAIGSQKIKLIGVDTDQAQSYNANADLFLTSITKNIATAFEDIFAKVSNNTSKQINQSIKGFGETTEGTLENQLVGIVGESALGTELATLKAEAAKVTMTWDEAYKYMSQN